MTQGEITVVHFVQKVHKGILSSFYFMHDEPHELTLMEDSALVHRSKLLENWRQAHNMKKLVWPTNSLDLNPIENLWKIIKDLLHHYNMPKNKQELIELIQQIWNEISLEQLKRLISTMLNRMQAMISANGGSTRW